MSGESVKCIAGLYVNKNVWNDCFEAWNGTKFHCLYLRKSLGLLPYLELAHLGKLLKPHVESRQLTIRKFNLSELWRQTPNHLFCISLHLVLRHDTVQNSGLEGPGSQLRSCAECYQSS